MTRTLRSVACVLALALCWAGAAHAGAFRITLADGTQIVGTIRAFEDGIYTIATSTGEREATLTQLVSLEPIAFKSVDAGAGPQETDNVPVPEFTFMAANSRVVVGSLQAFDDGIYEIRTRAGVVALRAAEVQWIELAWMEKPQTIAPKGRPLPSGTVRMAGSDSMATVYMPVLIETFAGSGNGKDPRWSRGSQAQVRTFSASGAGNGKFVAEVLSADTAAAVLALAERQTDIAMLPRRMLPQEAKYLAERGLGNMLSPAQEFELAPTALAVIAHPSNPVKALRPGQIADIFAGRIRNWSEVGGSGRRIRVLAPARTSSVLDVFHRELFGTAELMPTADLMASSTEMSETVAIDTAAIGFVEYASIGNAAALALIDTCDRPVALTKFNIQTRDYPLATTLYLYAFNTPAPATRAFLDFATSMSAQKALQQNRLPNALPTVLPIDEPLLRSPSAAQWPVSAQRVAAQVEKFVANASRASIAIRFVQDGVRMEPDGERELNRLVDLVRGMSPEPRLVLLGFSDMEGDLANSVRLSERRARFVEQRLKKLGIEAEEAFGLGPLRPVACDGAPSNRARNRRVEAWLLK